jgi:hypothetical protein
MSLPALFFSAASYLQHPHQLTHRTSVNARGVDARSGVFQPTLQDGFSALQHAGLGLHVSQRALESNAAVALLVDLPLVPAASSKEKGKNEEMVSGVWVVCVCV